jgi:antitoxin VapB
MSQVAKIFTNGRSQAVRLPAAFRFEGDEVFVRKDEETGDVILSRKQADWDSFFRVVDGAPAPADFLDREERDQVAKHERDPFAGWTE